MKAIVRYLLLVSIFSLGIGVFSPVKKCMAQDLEVGVLDFPPYYVVKSPSDVEGLYIDLQKMVLDKAGFKYKITGFPPPRLYDNVASGVTNLWLGTTGVKVYENEVIVSPEMIHQIHLRVYTVGDKVLPKTKEELKSKTFITIHGYNYGGFIKYLTDPANTITLDPVTSHQSAFLRLKSGRGDYVLDYREPADVALKEVSIQDLKYSDLMTIGIYFNLSKKTPDAENVMKRIMEAYTQLKKENLLPKGLTY